ncbi:hypothetical protein J3R82DRAFT_136 [Butyriboletus roseoflavus]|nr:hypothetical protein J3R82DRAFT_136 [Butyriboletus roseoflavus]
MLQSYLKGAKLHFWLSYPQCPPTVQELKVLLDCTYCNTPDDDSFADSLDSTELQKAVVVPSDLQWLVNRCTSLCAYIKLTGVIYRQSSAYIGNSLVLFYPLGNHLLSSVPSSIKYIYETTGVLMFAIQRQCTLPADGNSADVFAAYSHFLTKLLYTPLPFVMCWKVFKLDGSQATMHSECLRKTLW